MIKKFIYFTIALAIYILPASAFADTYFVRPYVDGGYGASDGTSYTTAFNGFSSATISAGDTLKICGAFASSSANSAFSLFIASTSGSVGNPTVYDGDCSEQGDLAQAELNASGRQFGLFIIGAVSYVTVKNIEIFGADTSTNANRFLLRLCNDPGTVCNNVTLSNIHLHDIVDPGASNEAVGIWGYCDNCVIDDWTIHNIPSDGIWLGSAENTEISNGHCYNVGESGRNTGDCIQLSGVSNAWYIHNNILDHSSTEAKQALMDGSSGSGARLIGNTMIMGTQGDQTTGVSKTVLIMQSNVTIERNTISGGWAGLWVASPSSTIRNNIISGAYEMNLVFPASADTQTFVHNIIDCKSLGGAVGVNMSGTGYSRTLNNNIITGCSPGVQKGGTGTLNFENNILYNNTTNHLWFVLPATNLLTDPGLVSIAGSDYLQKFDSASIDTATTSVAMFSDYLGNPVYGIADIGPHEYQPPYMMSVDNINPSGGVRVYADGKYRYTSATSTASAINFSVLPFGGAFPNFGTSSRPSWLDLFGFSWDNSDTYRKEWTATGQGATTTKFVVGDLLPNAYYAVSVDDTQQTTVQANADGKIEYTYSEGWFTHVFNVDPVAVTCSLSFNQTTINEGDSALLNWSSEFAATASLDQGIGEVATSGSLSITSASGTNIYTLSVTGGGSGVGTTCTAVITVNPAPRSSSGGSGSSHPTRKPASLGTLEPATTTDFLTPPEPEMSIKPISAPLVITYTYSRNLTLKDTGNDVRALQDFLINRGYNIPAGATGYFGTQTQTALAAYQRDSGVSPAVGYFGPLTRAKVNSAGQTNTTPAPPANTRSVTDHEAAQKLIGVLLKLIEALTKLREQAM